MLDDKNGSDDVKFDLTQVEKTFTQYKLNEILYGVVVQKRENGVVFNVGGKLDAFIPKTDFEDFSLVKFGDRFKVIITNMHGEEGMIEVSKTKADNIIEATTQAGELKIGKAFSFVVLSYTFEGLFSKLGEYEIFVPISQINAKPYNKNLKQFIGKKYEAIVMEIDNETKQISASIFLAKERKIESIENAFYSSIFVGKLVSGKVVNILPYGAFCDVNGVTCFCHISQISHKRVDDISKFLLLGKEYTFKIFEIDKENKRVSLSLKALEKSEKEEYFDNLREGDILDVKVFRLLPFGAICKDIKSGYSGLLHIDNAKGDSDKQIKDIVKIGDVLNVTVKEIDIKNFKLYFELNFKK